MVAMQFSCPHCGGVFQVDPSACGGQVACPHCRGIVAVPGAARPVPPGPHHSVPPGPQTAPPGPTGTAPTHVGPAWPESPASIVPSEDRDALRSLAAEQRQFRRRTRNIILWVLGLVVLAVTLYVLLATGPVH